MRPDLSVKLGLLTVAVATAALVGGWTIPAPARNDGNGSVERWQRTEVARIQEHLAGAERMLLDADVASLSPSQRAARARNVELLRGYRERGVFPRNIHFADSREPYFVDDRGVLCAMAYLIARSGRTDIVERIRATRNNARIRELADDAALIAWLDEAGLTAAEAARIQPMYDGRCVACVIGDDEQKSSGTGYGYAAASVVASAANVFAVASNVPRGATPRPRWRGAMALISGTAGIALGASAVGDGGAAGAIGVWNVAVGTLASMAGSHTLLASARARRASSPAAPTAAEPPADGTPRADVGLHVRPTMGARPGLSVTVSF